MKRVLVLVNPKAGVPRFFDLLRRAFDRFWDVAGTNLVYQFSQSEEDGIAKAKAAVANGVEIILVVGGDGTVSSIGRVLLNTDTTIGVVPTGSGNGFARHFGIPLSPAKAIAALASASAVTIDVGVMNGAPFLVTCSMAWDASIVRSFDKMPIRGILPYVFAGVYEFFDFQPQRFHARIDDREELVFPDPLFFTIANLTQYGGGAIIAPRARPDDGRLELVVARRRHLPHLVANIRRFFDGTVHHIPQVVSRSFSTLVVRRERRTVVQIDGELREAPLEITVTANPKALRVLAPVIGA
ncbi:MAG: diacylglycerol kinase family protein [Verrucomicrobiota bacterium]|nr:diacylglycerol kinase family protein [Verrucomicrobiota bacterium]